ncbi:protein SMAX1-LIKE 3 isoform X2 [Cryptomeria japonica]|uniref:protein SMAX1-LIKE 3 isoform X2 n=1 Tax=Cryptomeria japonica TaxID=3369 RepID=UPI0027DA0938|nr:protein SMAX1-LIKE 3 isoform X2 [Cryptomeria japonica]
MRAGGCTVQQTLTAEAASVVEHAVALARQRGHAQVTPLHVAATLLSPGSSNILRRACLKSHAHSSSHPLQCRALELCFKVALNRLPTTAGPLVHAGQPPLSNSLVAVLKRAQAQQRRGCLEQQQQPLLAMKVEIEQLVISILDDPSVSRVMREAGFSSTSVKSNIEEEVSVPVNFPCFSMDHSNSTNEVVPVSRSVARSLIPGGFETGCNMVYSSGGSSNRGSRINLFENPMFGGYRLKNEDVESVLEVLVGKKCRRMNSVIVGDCSVTTENVVREVVSRIERGDVPDLLKGVQVLDPQFSSLVQNGLRREEIEEKLGELRGTVSNCLVGGSAIIFAGDLRWAVEVHEDGDNNNSSYYNHNRNSSNSFSCVQYMTMELGRILRIREEGRRVWLLATASYQTYMTCLTGQPSLENLWGLQAVSVPSGGLDLSLQPCLTSKGEPKTSGVSTEAFVPIPENHLRQMPFLKMINSDEDVVEKLNCCYQCSANFEEEAKLLCRTEQSLPLSDPNLPLWLQKCRTRNVLSEPDAAAQEEAKLRELRKKWNQACERMHCNYYNPIHLQQSALEVPQHPASMVSSVNHHSPWWGSTQSNASGVSASRNKESSSVLQSTTTFQDWVDSPLSRQTAEKAGDSSAGHPAAAKDSSRVDVETTLTLGLSDSIVKGNDDEANKCTASSHVAPLSFSRPLQFEMSLRQFDPESLKVLSERLAEKVPWQSEQNIQAIATAVLQNRSGMAKGESRMMSKGDTWLLALGADRMGKKKMAQALAEIIYGSQEKLLCLPSPWSPGKIYQEPVKTYLDKLTLAIANDPHCVLLLDDMEQADIFFMAAILRAMESGKLTNSNGREVSLCDTIVFMTSSLGTNHFMNSSSQIDEEKLSRSILRCPRGFKLDVQERGDQVQDKLGLQTCKRKIQWDLVQAKETERRKRISRALDLNVETGHQDHADAASMTGNSDVTEETDALSDQIFRSARAHFSEYFFKLLDECIVFCAFDFSQLAESIQDKLHHSYCRATIGRGFFEVDELVVERMVRFCWELAPFGTDTFDKWVEEVFEVGLVQMLSMQTLTGKTTVKLSEGETNEGDSFYGNSLLPSRLEITGCSNCQFMADEFTVCRMQRHHSNTKALIQVRA